MNQGSQIERKKIVGFSFFERYERSPIFHSVENGLDISRKTGDYLGINVILLFIFLAKKASDNYKF